MRNSTGASLCNRLCVLAHDQILGLQIWLVRQARKSMKSLKAGTGVFPVASRRLDEVAGPDAEHLSVSPTAVRRQRPKVDPLRL